MGDFTAQERGFAGLCLRRGLHSAGPTETSVECAGRAPLRHRSLGVDHATTRIPDNGLAQINELTQRGGMPSWSRPATRVRRQRRNRPPRPPSRSRSCARAAADTRYPRIGLGAAPTDRRSAQRRSSAPLRGRGHRYRHHDRGVDRNQPPYRAISPVRDIVLWRRLELLGDRGTALAAPVSANRGTPSGTPPACRTGSSIAAVYVTGPAVVNQRVQESMGIQWHQHGVRALAGLRNRNRIVQGRGTVGGRCPEPLDRTRGPWRR